ncbi:MAG TPA: Lrp/AsnC ligand binding domain-containing protein [Chloroflexota bacterium]|nr:Lrp/AsnC ligand binding domain-containing protein [Chloroflexota bacterium]
MRLQEVLRKVDGLEKRFVYYLESQGYIHPAKLQKRRIARRDYSPEDLERIRGIWHYYQRGISVQRAYELVTREAADGAYVVFPAAPRRLGETLELLRQSDHVVEAGAVYGETAQLVAVLRAPHESDVHVVLDRLFEAGMITGAARVFRFSAGNRWRGSPPEDARDAARGGGIMRAWVLIKVPAKQIGGLVEALRAFPGIVEAAAIYGETDVIAKIEVPNQAALDELVMQRIQSIEAVESTRTFIAVGGMHWERDA